MRWWKVVTLSVVALGAWATGAVAASARGASVVPTPARTHVGVVLPPGASPEPAAGSALRLDGFKVRSRQLQRSEGGVALSLGERVTLQLHYTRTALAPMMREDHDDGVLARVRLAF